MWWCRSARSQAFLAQAVPAGNTPAAPPDVAPVPSATGSPPEAPDAGPGRDTAGVLFVDEPANSEHDDDGDDEDEGSSDPEEDEDDVRPVSGSFWGGRTRTAALDEGELLRRLARQTVSVAGPLGLELRTLIHIHEMMGYRSRHPRRSRSLRNCMRRACDLRRCTRIRRSSERR